MNILKVINNLTEYEIDRLIEVLDSRKKEKQIENHSSVLDALANQEKFF